MRKIPALAVGLLLAGAHTLSAQQVSLGQGCTTATYIDKDCDGFGVGKKSSGLYLLGESTTYTTGDLPDADDDDPTVNTTATWESKWSGSIAGFLQQRRGFTNTGRIFYLSQSGSNSTGVVNDKARPFRTMAPVLTALRDLQGGVVVVRGGMWSDLYLSPCEGGNPCYAPSGTASKPVYILAYPGERVETSRVLGHDGSSYWPNRDMRYVTIDGFQWKSPEYGLGDAVRLVDVDHITIRNCEFAGWHQIFFGNHSEDILIEQNVFHDMGTHTIYFGSYGMVSYGAADFDFADDAAKYAAGQSPGASARGRILGNVMYNSGSGGYEPIHINTYTRDNLIEGNIISYCGGTGIGLQSGVYHTTVRNNAVFENGRAAITLSLYGPDTQAATIRYITIENNTLWTGKRGTSIRGTTPGAGIEAHDYSSSTGHWIKDVIVRNNVIVTDNYSFSWGNPALSFRRNSYPDTWTVQNNVIWSSAAGASPGDRVMVIAADAYPTGATAGNYAFSQFQTYAPTYGGNLYSDPGFNTASPGFTLTPWLFDFALRPSSPALRAGTSSSAVVDIKGLARTRPVDAGAFGQAGVTPPSAPKGVVIR